MALEQLTEFIVSREPLGVDREKNIIRGVKLCGLESRNGRSYTSTALKGAISLYEGAKVNVNHPTGRPSDPRDLRDRIGTIQGVVYREGQGLYGDVKFNPKHQLAEQLVWACENDPSSCGMSHNISGSTSRKDGRTVVESIAVVQAVDWVADPATTSGMYEHHESNHEDQAMEWSKVTADDLKKNCGPLLEQIAAEANIDSGKDAQIKTLKEQLDAYQVKEKLAAKKDSIGKLIAEAKLPAELVSDIFVESLLAANDEAAVKSLIEDRASLARKSSGKKPESKRSGDEDLTESYDAPDPKRFATSHNRFAMS